MPNTLPEHLAFFLIVCFVLRMKLCIFVVPKINWYGTQQVSLIQDLNSDTVG